MRHEQVIRIRAGKELEGVLQLVLSERVLLFLAVGVAMELLEGSLDVLVEELVRDVRELVSERPALGRHVEQ